MGLILCVFQKLTFSTHPRALQKRDEWAQLAIDKFVPVALFFFLLLICSPLRAPSVLTVVFLYVGGKYSIHHKEAHLASGIAVDQSIGPSRRLGEGG